MITWKEKLVGSRIRGDSWQKIATDMGLSTDEVREEWTNLTGSTDFRTKGFDVIAIVMRQRRGW